MIGERVLPLIAWHDDAIVADATLRPLKSCAVNGVSLQLDTGTRTGRGLAERDGHMRRKLVERHRFGMGREAGLVKGHALQHGARGFHFGVEFGEKKIADWHEALRRAIYPSEGSAGYKMFAFDSPQERS